MSEIEFSCWQEIEEVFCFQILELLDHPTLAHAAALGFEIISLEHPELHLPILKHLFKQKLFQIVLKKLWSKLADFNEHHLTAFVHVLRITPHIVLKMNLDKVSTSSGRCYRKLSDEFTHLFSHNPIGWSNFIQVFGIGILDSTTNINGHMQWIP